MSPSIEVDDEVWEALKSEAEAFVDTPNTVLRRLLRIDRAASSSAAAVETPTRASSRASNKPKRARVPAGSLLPESEYIVPILKVLKAHGGSAASRDVTDEVGAIVKDRLLPMDHDLNESGEVRWKSRVQFTRLRMKERRLLKDNSPRGIWEISDAGLKYLSKN